MSSRGIFQIIKKNLDKKYFFIMEKTFFKNLFETFFHKFFSKFFEILKFSFFKLTFRRFFFENFSISKNVRKQNLRKVNFKNENFKISIFFPKNCGEKKSRIFFRSALTFFSSIGFSWIFFLKKAIDLYFPKRPKK